MKRTKLTQKEADRLRRLYREHPAPIPSDIELLDGRILTYRTHQDRRASAVTLFAIADQYLAVDYDGDPMTVDIGVRGPDTDVFAVITIKPEIFKDAGHAPG